MREALLQRRRRAILKRSRAPRWGVRQWLRAFWGHRRCRPLEYSIPSQWHVRGSVDEIAALYCDPEQLSRWWPSCFLTSRLVEEGNADQTGKRVSVRIKGALPYTFAFQFEVSRALYPHYFTGKLRGAIEGYGVCRVLQVGDTVVLDHTWNIRPRSLFLILLTLIAKPVGIANHLWIMRRGEASLERALARRRGDLAPPPPGPTFPHNLRRTSASVGTSARRSHQHAGMRE